MGTYLVVKDMDQLYRESGGAVVVNDLNTVTKEQRDFLDRISRTEYSADTISTIPRCDCGALTDGFQIGTICDICGTPVQEVFHQEISPIAWIRSPIGVPALINPAILALLNDTFVCGAGREASKFPYFAWLINPAVVAKTAYERMVCDILLNAGLVRGYTQFINHFDDYVDKLFFEIRIPTLAASKKPTIKPMKVIDLNTPVFEYLKPYFPDVPNGRVHPVHAVIRLYRKIALCQYVSLPNKALLILEKTHYGTYADGPVTELIDTIKTIVGIDTALSRANTRFDAEVTMASPDGVSPQECEALSQKQVENRTVKTLFKLLEYHASTQKEILSKKEGIYRKQVYGTRVCWSMRCVISSITKAHRYDEIHTPWAASVSMFELHLQNKLVRRGYTPNEAKELLQAHTHKYHPLIDELFGELLRESPEGRIPVFINRNPSLTRTSAQCLYIGKIKTDPSDNTVSLSILGVVAFNADFDGDTTYSACSRMMGL